MIKYFFEKCTGTFQSDVEKKKLQKQRAIMLYARELDITLGDTEQCWKWFSVREKGESFDVAELLDVFLLEVRGSFDDTDLEPDTRYEVLFLMKMKSSSCRWVKPVKLELTLPSGLKMGYEKKFSEIPRSKDKWFELKIGEFWTPQRGKLDFSMNSGPQWRKTGLLIKGVLVRPAEGSNN